MTRHSYRSTAFVLACAVAPCLVEMALAEERKPETPKDAYDLRLICAGAAAAAVARTDMTTSNSEKDRADAQTALTAIRNEALAFGDRIGLAEAQVSDEIDRSRLGILKKIDEASSPEAREKEEKDLGETVIRCALVEAIERREREKGAPASGKP